MHVARNNFLEVKMFFIGITILFFALPVTVSAFGCKIQQPGQPDTCSPLPGMTQAESQTQCTTTRCPQGGTCTVVDDPICLSLGGVGSALPITTSSINALKKDADSKIKVIELQNPLSDTDIPAFIGSIVGKAFGLIGTLAVVAFIYGGFQWLTSAGNEEKVSKGMHVMTYAAIGIVVIFSSYAVLNTVINGLTKGISTPPNGESRLRNTANTLPRTDDSGTQARSSNERCVEIRCPRAYTLEECQQSSDCMVIANTCIVQGDLPCSTFTDAECGKEDALHCQLQ